MCSSPCADQCANAFRVMSRSFPWPARVYLEPTTVLMQKGLIFPCSFFCLFNTGICYVAHSPSVWPNTTSFLHSQFQTLQSNSTFYANAVSSWFASFSGSLGTAQTFGELYRQTIFIYSCSLFLSFNLSYAPTYAKQPVLEELLMREHVKCIWEIHVQYIKLDHPSLHACRFLQRALMNVWNISSPCTSMTTNLFFTTALANFPSAEVKLTTLCFPTFPGVCVKIWHLICHLLFLWHWG